MTTIVNPTPEQLNELMDFGQLVQVWHTGGKTYLSDDRGTGHSWPSGDPEECLAIYGDDPDESQLKAYLNPGWSFVTGYTGQYSYNGPAFHDSERIGGGLARAILELDGFYVASCIDYYSDEPDAGGEEPYTEGWVITYFSDGIV